MAAFSIPVPPLRAEMVPIDGPLLTRLCAELSVPYLAVTTRVGVPVSEAPAGRKLPKSNPIVCFCFGAIVGNWPTAGIGSVNQMRIVGFWNQQVNCEPVDLSNIGKIVNNGGEPGRDQMA